MDSKGLRERAEELRVIAGSMRDDYAVQTLLQCAVDYEKIAKVREVIFDEYKEVLYPAK